MPINKRISKDTELHDPSDNVITTADRAKDARGIFDPRKDPLAGSIFDGLSDDVEVRGEMLSRLGHLGAQLEDIPRPEELRTQDLLTLARSSRNRCSIEQRYRDRIVSPLSAIRAFCVTVCQSGSVKAVGLCTSVSCPLWAFRMGTNGMRGKQ